MSDRVAPPPYRSWTEYWEAFFERNPARRVERDLVVEYSKSASPVAQRFLSLRYGRYFGAPRDLSMKKCAAALDLPEDELLAMQKAMLSEVLPKLFDSPEYKAHRPVVSPLTPEPPSSPRDGG
jgi:hypothetical protein